MTGPLHWDLVEETLSTVFRDATGLESVWLNQKTKHLPCPFGVLSLGGIAGVGPDETLYEYDAAAPAGQEIEVTLRGVRRFSWTVRVNSQAHGSKKSGHPSALYYLERLRTLIRSERLRAKMRGVSLALVDVGALVSLDFPLDGRMVSSAAMDVILTAGVAIVDCPITFIESVEVTSDFKDVDGVSLPADVQLDGEIIP